MSATLYAPAGHASRPTIAPSEDGTRTIRVALAGCGVVGSALVRLIERESAATLASRAHVRLELARVLVRDRDRARDAHLDARVLTTDVDEFLATPADVVVEAIGGLEPAARIARAALTAGMRVVTANKGLVAAHGPQLLRRAARERTTFDFEAAVGGAVPVVRALREGVAGIGVRGVRGVVNGTCNYLLSRLADGARYADALAEAQRLGFAESDPARDVGGEDAADKIRVLAWLAFGVDPALLPVRRRGIVPHTERLVALATAVRSACKLVAECVETEAGVVASVEPIVVNGASDLGRVDGEHNVVLVESHSAGQITLAGKGAGGLPTAGALMADILRGASPLSVPAAAHVAPADRRVLRWLVAAPPPSVGDVRRLGLDRGLIADDVGTAATPLLAISASRHAVDRVELDAARAGLTIDVIRWEE